MHAPPARAYVRNNPMSYTDPTGASAAPLINDIGGSWNCDPATDPFCVADTFFGGGSSFGGGGNFFGTGCDPTDPSCNPPPCNPGDPTCCNPLTDPFCCEARLLACRQNADSTFSNCLSGFGLDTQQCLKDCAQAYPPQSGPLALAAFVFCTASCRVGAGSDAFWCAVQWALDVQECGYSATLCTGSKFPLPSP
jgi:hypothetical protein